MTGVPYPCYPYYPDPWRQWTNPNYTQPNYSWPTATPPQSLPVNLPIPIYGTVTIAIMEADGSITIKVSQDRPAPAT